MLSVLTGSADLYVCLMCLFGFSAVWVTRWNCYLVPMVCGVCVLLYMVCDGYGYCVVYSHCYCQWELKGRTLRVRGLSFVLSSLGW